MKTFFKVITLAAAMASISTVQAADVQKIGVVFPSKVMQESPQRDRTIKKLESEFKSRYEKLQASEKEIKNLENKIKKDHELLSKKDLTELQRKIESKVSDYKLTRKAYAEDRQRRLREEQQKETSAFLDVIDAVAKEGKYDLILNGEQSLFVKPELDISNKVIQKFSTK